MSEWFAKNFGSVLETWKIVQNKLNNDFSIFQEVAKKLSKIFYILYYYLGELMEN